MNQRNNFSLIGRLAHEPRIFDNKDGSKKIRMTIATRDNFRSTDNQGNKDYGSQYVPVEAFISSQMAERDGLGIYANMHKGSLVGMTGSIQNDNYMDKDGKLHYNLVLRVETRDILEPKYVTEARLARELDDSGEASEMPF